MNHFLLTPLVAFAVCLVLSAGVSALSKRLAALGSYAVDKESAYACGELIDENKAQPDYSEFFKFVFFFTILHVIALVVATFPGGFTYVSIAYLGVTVLALYMLLRR